MDGQRPEPEGLDLRNFLKSDSGDAAGTCELGTELERVGKRFQSLAEEVLDEGFGKIEVRRYILVVGKTLLGYLYSPIGTGRRMFVFDPKCAIFMQRFLLDVRDMLKLVS